MRYISKKRSVFFGKGAGLLKRPLYLIPSNGAQSKLQGFTLIEILVSVSLLVIAMGITFTTFYSVSNAWQRGLRMAENLHHGEYVMDQIVHGLRSAFVPDSSVDTETAFYGFKLDGGGYGSHSTDKFSWAKRGPALLGLNDPLSKGVHRVQVTIEDDEDGRSAVAVRTWRTIGQPEGFDPEQLKPFFISTKVTGIGCRVSTNHTDNGWEWETEWDENNASQRLPLAVEITLYLEPLHEDEEAFEMKRLVKIPAAPLSWKKETRERRTRR